MESKKYILLTNQFKARKCIIFRGNLILKIEFLSFFLMSCIYATSQMNFNDPFKLANKVDNTLQIGELVSINLQFQPFTTKEPISGLALSGEVRLHSDSSMVRVILVDAQQNEYLVYEAYPLLVIDADSFIIENVGEETSLFNNIIPSELKIEIVDAELYVKELLTSREQKYGAQARNNQIQLQQSAKIEKINNNIKKKGLLWLAGETSVSNLSYTEKKQLFGDKIPNLQGFEYYIGGIFVLPGALESEETAGLNGDFNIMKAEPDYVDEFDWRNRHGQFWPTPVKNQDSCGSCWAFDVTGATELLVNLFYNQHLDLDLSEQDVLSCSGAGNCSGGIINNALNYIKNTGIVDEICFPYLAYDQSCSYKCSTPSERIRIGSVGYSVNGKNIKREIIKGPAAGTILFWNHAMMLTGYKVLKEGDNININDQGYITIPAGDPLIGKTAWIFKNSWGDSFGDHGYVYIVGNIGEIIATSFNGPLQALRYSEANVVCTDNDHDGYYWWGIGQKPAHCPACPDEPDGDDSDPDLGPMDRYGNMRLLQRPIGNDITICNGNPVPPLTAVGENIKWYIDNKLTDPLIDPRDGQSYKTVTIGDQTWMAENLNYYTPTGSCYYNDDSITYADTYGRLYNWETAQNICPVGMRLPSDEEWKDLERFLGLPKPDNFGIRGTNEGGKLKEVDTAHWYPPNKLATDAYGFKALPGGDRVNENSEDMHYSANFWSSTLDEENTLVAYSRTLNYNLGGISRYGASRIYGYSVRCMKAGDLIVLHTGDSYNTGITQPGTYTFYCTQTINGYESLADTVTLSINPIPSSPVAEDVTACTGEPAPTLISVGENIKWYTGGDPSQPIHDTRDGQTYKTVTIGDQTWMAENLNYYTPTGSWYYNDDSLSYAGTYGKLYNWYAVNTGNLCPSGWHIPSDTEWTALTSYLGDESAGDKLKEAGTTHWASPNTGATNETGFTALPGGYRNINGSSYVIGSNGYWWSSTESGTNDAWFRDMIYDRHYVARYSFYKETGHSVRCICDASLVATGNTFTPDYSEPGAYPFYATQTVAGCESSADTVTLTINPVPPPPVAEDVAACDGELVPDLLATGDNVQWYSDTILTDLIHTGNSYTTGLTQPGIYMYYVTQTISNCESQGDSVRLLIYALPTVYLGKDTTITTQQNLTLKVNNTDYSYLWSNGSNMPYIEISASEIGLGNHSFWLIVTDTNSCTNVDTILLTVVNPTNILVPNAGNTILIYPNPGNDILFIDFHGIDPEDFLIKIINQLGNEVYLEKYQSIYKDGRMMIDILAWPKGCYNLLIIGNKIRYSEKIIIY